MLYSYKYIVILFLTNRTIIRIIQSYCKICVISPFNLDGVIISFVTRTDVIFRNCITCITYGIIVINVSIY